MSEEAPRSKRNVVVHKFLEEAYKLHSVSGVGVLSKKEIFDNIGMQVDHDALSYMTKLDFIREESSLSFSLTDRGISQAQKV